MNEIEIPLSSKFLDKLFSPYNFITKNIAKYIPVIDLYLKNENKNERIIRWLHTIFGKYCKYDIIDKNWYVFNGQFWVILKNVKAEIIIDKFKLFLRFNSDYILNSEIIINILSKIDFKECRNVFTDPEFLLDANPNLIMFENGVFDLKNKIFRKATYSDNISKSTRTNYIFPEEESFTELENYLENNIPNYKNILGGLLKYQDKLLHIWQGITPYGEIHLMTLIRWGFGEYYQDGYIYPNTDKNFARYRGIRVVDVRERDLNEFLRFLEVTNNTKLMCKVIMSTNMIMSHPSISITNFPNLISLSQSLLFDFSKQLMSFIINKCI